MKSPETADGSRGCVPSATLCYPPQHTESFRDVTLLSPRRTWISSRLENKPLMWWKWILSCSQCKEKKIIKENTWLYECINEFCLQLIKLQTQANEQLLLLKECLCWIFSYHYYLSNLLIKSSFY